MIGALATAAICAMAQDPTDAEDFRSYVDQARFFIRKQWYADAREQLEAAVGTEDGRLDPEAWFLLATVRFELGDIDGARWAADRSNLHARDAAQADQTRAFLDLLSRSFGDLVLETQRSGVVTDIDIELVSAIFEPSLKRYLNSVIDQLGAQVTLPHTVVLPAGTYRVNDAEVVVSGGQATHHLVDLRGAGPMALQVAQVELGVGAGLWFGSATSNLLPSPATHLAVSYPVGPLSLGAVLDWTPRLYQTRTGDVDVSGRAWSGGVRAGVEVPGLDPVVIRPSVGYRYGLLPGLELACAGRRAAFACGDPKADHELYVYSVGAVHLPTLELAALYLDRTRRRGLGGGVEAIVQFAAGRFPGEADARVDGNRDEVSYTVEATALQWRALGLGMTATVAYSF